MHPLEKNCKQIRHSKYLKRMNFLWALIRPAYRLTLRTIFRKGIYRVINGTDKIQLTHKFSTLSNEFEPKVWKHFMSNLKPNDIVAEVGAYIGIYTIATAKRLSRQGKIFAFEPNPENYTSLSEHVRLNRVSDKTKIIQLACGENEDKVSFFQRGSESHVVSSNDLKNGVIEVGITTLDKYFGNHKIDILKIDVEGYEEFVIRGCREILSDEKRKPRLIYIEVHPYAWKKIGVSSHSLLSLLSEHGYQIYDLQDNLVSEIFEYGEIIAKKNSLHKA